MFPSKPGHSRPHQAPLPCKSFITSKCLHPNFKTDFSKHFIGRSMWNAYGTWGAMTRPGLSTTWIWYVFISSLPGSILKPAQALNVLEPSGFTFRKCLRELRSICGNRGILPTSYLLSSHLLDVHPRPFASGSFGDVYKGTFDSSSVCIKHVRFSLQDDQNRVLKVRHRCYCFPRQPSLTEVAGVLPRSCGVETHGTSKYRTPPGYHHLSTAPNDFGLDAW